MSLSEDEAAQIAEAFYASKQPSKKIRLGNRESGLKLIKERGCLSCHYFSGVLKEGPVSNLSSESVRLAPDLRFATDRMTDEMLSSWLTDPQKVSKSSLMPKPQLLTAEIEDIIAALHSTQRHLEQLPSFDRTLKVVSEKITFEQINSRIFDRVCRHCHANEAKTGGPAGAGNTGGFGYLARGLDLSGERGLRRGVFIRGTKQYRSVIAPGEDGLPLIVKVLIARHDEMAGRSDNQIIGMPLGLSPIAREDIELLYNWCIQQSS